ncbi:hypothetical protein LCGC14_2669540 [marine sediment metagenome]|uniref:Uncharacterized protein n=1 Tax=marine sediment metagenome TaxID=412755 RepID=A0A0F8ZPK3_9ZZZZ
MTKSVDLVTLKPNTGLSWKEITLAQLTAQNVTESTELNNPQQFSDTAFTVTPTVTGVHTFVSNRVGARITKKTLTRMGRLAQDAIERLKDTDGLTAIDAFTTSLGGTGSALASGFIRAARSRITSNTTEPAPQSGEIFGVFHGFQIKDIEDEILNPTTGVLQAQLEAGKTAQVFANGVVGAVGSVIIREDGNLTINAGTTSAKGGVFHRSSLVLVQGRSPWVLFREEPHIGGGGTSMWQYDEYAYGERSAGNWGFEVQTDATTPTS